MKKHYLAKNIWINVARNQSDSLIIFGITISITIFLSILYFFGYDDSIEKNIATNLNLSLKINSNHVLDEDKAMQKKIFGQTDLEKVFAFIEDVGKLENIQYMNYNTIIDGTNDFVGISQVEFFERNEKKLLEGRLLTQQEIDEKIPYTVVSEDMIIYDNGMEKKVQVGDKVYFYLGDPVEFEVIGIYDSHYKEVISYIDDVEARNLNKCFISNKFLTDIIYAKETTPLSVHVKNIEFVPDSYKNYVKLHKTISKKIEELKRSVMIDPKFEILITDAQEVFNSTLRIKNIYKTVLIMTSIVIGGFLVTFIFYVLDKKANEIKIYHSLGMNRKDIVFHYCLSTLLVSTFGVVIGLVVGYMISLNLVNNMLIDNQTLLKELFAFNENVSNAKGISPDYLFDLNKIIIITLHIIVIYVTSITIKTNHILSTLNRKK